MQAVTWNVNSLKVRLPRVLELLGEHRYRKGPKASDHAPLLAELAS